MKKVICKRNKLQFYWHDKFLQYMYLWWRCSRRCYLVEGITCAVFASLVQSSVVHSYCFGGNQDLAIPDQTMVTLCHGDALVPLFLLMHHFWIIAGW
jgi:hypothetical protein